MFLRLFRNTVLSLMFVASSLGSASAVAGNATLALADELHQKLTKAPESLRWHAPNHGMELTHKNIGLEPERCSKPVPVMTGKTHRFLVRCETTQLENLRTVELRTVTSWAYSDDGWKTGQILSIHKLASRYGRSLTMEDRRKNFAENRERIKLPLGVHRGYPNGQFEESFALVSQPRIDKLIALWEKILTTDNHLPLASLESWRQLSWPDGVVGIRRDRQLLLQNGPLNDTSELLDKLDQQKSLPPFAQGLIRPTPSVRSWQSPRPLGDPMFLLDTLYVNRTDYAIAISDRAPDDSYNDVQLLSEGLPYHLVFMPIERNL